MFVIRRVCVVTEAERKERKRRRKEKKENRRARAVAMRTAKHGIVCFGVVMCGERPARGFSRCSFFRFVLRLFALGLACSVVFSRSFVLDNKNIVQNATSIDPHLRRRLNGIFRYLLRGPGRPASEPCTFLRSTQLFLHKHAPHPAPSTPQKSASPAVQ